MHVVYMMCARLLHQDFVSMAQELPVDTVAVNVQEEKKMVLPHTFWHTSLHILAHCMPIVLDTRKHTKHANAMEHANAPQTRQRTH